MKSITVVCKDASLPGEGILTKVFYISSYLKKYGWSVNLITSNQPHTFFNFPDLYNDANFEITKINSLKFTKNEPKKRLLSWLLFDIKVFLLLLFKKRTDIYFVSSIPITSLFSVYLLSRIKKSKYVIDIRDIWPLTLIDEASYSENSIPIKIFSFIERFCSNQSDLVVSSIPLLYKYNLDILKVDKKFTFMPICIDEYFLDNEFKRKRVTNNDSISIGYTGTVGMANDLNNLLNAAEKLKYDKRFEFIIIGDGPLLDFYIQKFKNNNKIKFLGQIPRKEINHYYEKFDIGFISVSNAKVWKYGQSLNKLVSYMENAVPVIFACPNFFHKSMVDEADCGFFVSNQDSSDIVKILERIVQLDRESLKNLGENGRTWILRNRKYADHVQRLSNDLRALI